MVRRVIYSIDDGVKTVRVTYSAQARDVKKFLKNKARFERKASMRPMVPVKERSSMPEAAEPTIVTIPDLPKPKISIPLPSAEETPKKSQMSVRSNSPAKSKSVKKVK